MTFCCLEGGFSLSLLLLSAIAISQYASVVDLDFNLCIVPLQPKEHKSQNRTVLFCRKHAPTVTIFLFIDSLSFKTHFLTLCGSLV